MTARQRPALDRSSLPMRLWSKAKRYAWDPAALDLSKDREQWQTLSHADRERFLRLFALFHAGEEAVTVEIMPLLRAIAAEGRLEEEIYLTSFLWEEAKHVDLFDRYFEEVIGETGDLSRYWHDSYRRIFDDQLHEALARLDHDSSAQAQVRAAVTYNVMVEGVLAEAGYFLFSRALGHSGLLPGMYQAIRLLRRDESRHIAYGVHLISRLIVENGDAAYRAFLTRMGEMRPLVQESTLEFVTCFGGEEAFGVGRADLARYSERRTATRIDRIVASRTQTMKDIAAAPRRAEAPQVGFA